MHSRYLPNSNSSYVEHHTEMQLVLFLKSLVWLGLGWIRTLNLLNSKRMLYYYTIESACHKIYIKLFNCQLTFIVRTFLVLDIIWIILWYTIGFWGYLHKLGWRRITWDIEFTLEYSLWNWGIIWSNFRTIFKIRGFMIWIAS